LRNRAENIGGFNGYYIKAGRARFKSWCLAVFMLTGTSHYQELRYQVDGP